MGAFDLTLLADQLRVDRRHDALVKAIDLVAGANSVRLDLDEAANALANVRALLDGSVGPIAPERLPWLIEALQTHAVMLYCRATHTQPADRRLATGPGKLDQAQREARRHVTNLRDKVIAHFGEGGDQPQGNWVADRVVLQTEPVVHCSFPTARAGYKAHILNDLALLVAIAQAHCEKVFGARCDEVLRRIELARQDPAFDAKLEAHGFDEQSFFGASRSPGSPSTVEVAQAGAPFGVLGGRLSHS
jgi:hypothetical protein